MNETLLALIRKLPLNPQTAAALLPVIGRTGLAGVLVLARGYLGPLADQAGCGDRTKDRCCPAPGQGDKATGVPTTRPAPQATTQPPSSSEPPPSTTGTGTDTDTGNGSGTGTTGGLSACDSAVLGLALTKLVFELGELALHNPGLDPAGKLPVFTLDEHGRAPAMSVAHVLAAARLWQQHTARRDAEAQAAEAQAAAAARSPRAQLQAARTERYALTPRYSYVAPAATYRTPRS